MDCMQIYVISYFISHGKVTSEKHINFHVLKKTAKPFVTPVLRAILRRIGWWTTAKVVDTFILFDNKNTADQFPHSLNKLAWQ